MGVLAVVAPLARPVQYYRERVKRPRTQYMAEHAPSIFAGVCFGFANDEGVIGPDYPVRSKRAPRRCSASLNASSAMNTYRTATLRKTAARYSGSACFAISPYLFAALRYRSTLLAGTSRVAPRPTPTNHHQQTWPLNGVIGCEIGDHAAAYSRRRCGHGTQGGEGG